jgi:TolB-like protein
MATIYEFGPFRLEADADTLFRGAEPVALGGRAVALLRLLLEKAGKPVAKDALMEAAWPGLAIEESNLTVQIAALRRTFAAVEGGSTWIETLPRRGYRYVGPPAAILPDDSRQTWLPSATSDKPSIAVLPFSNLSGDPAQDYFSDGITEDVIAELSRFRSLFVVVVYRARSSDIREVGRQLGVRYVVEGSARRIGKRVRVTVKLLDAASGFTLWTERYDREIEDIFVPLAISRPASSSRPGSAETILPTISSWMAKHLDGLGGAHRDDPAAFDFLHFFLREPFVGPLLEEPGGRLPVLVELLLCARVFAFLEEVFSLVALAPGVGEREPAIPAVAGKGRWSRFSDGCGSGRPSAKAWKQRCQACSGPA